MQGGGHVTALGGALVAVVSARANWFCECGNGMQNCAWMEESAVMTQGFWRWAHLQLDAFQGVEEMRLDKEYGSCLWGFANQGGLHIILGGGTQTYSVS